MSASGACKNTAAHVGRRIIQIVRDDQYLMVTPTKIERPRAS